jgi:HAD superfamily phosphatase
MLAAAGCPIDPEEAVYIGDSVDDMDAAREAGMWRIGVVPPYVETDEHKPLLEEHGAHVVIDDLNTLPDVLPTLGERTPARSTR